MRRYAFSLLLCAAVASGICPANADDQKPLSDSTISDPAWTADPDTIAHIRQIVAATQGADGVFVVSADGAVHHAQSGLVCPPKFPNVDFWQAFNYPSQLGTGMDVGCDYGRNGADGVAVSKLSIFATKAPTGETLDQAFTTYRDEIIQTYPSAVSHGDAFNIQNKTPGKPSPLPELRSEEFAVTLNGRAFTSQLVIALQGGWIIEVRATYEGEGTHIEATKDESKAELVAAMGDRLMALHGLLRAARTIGK